MNNLTFDSFHIGDSVAMVPPIAKGNLDHSSVEYGIVMAVGNRYVEVKFEDRINNVEVEKCKLTLVN